MSSYALVSWVVAILGSLAVAHCICEILVVEAIASRQRIRRLDGVRDGNKDVCQQLPKHNVEPDGGRG